MVIHLNISEEDCCSEKNKCLNKKKRKHPLAGEESESSTNKAMTRRAKRKR